MSKQCIRLKFTKGNEVKYISHLDLMRAFQRALRRADIPISYSSGFNPHQEISFGAPLALGVTSNAEYLDMKLSEECNIRNVIEKLNSELPKGIKIIDGVVLIEKAKNAMSLVTHSKYRVCFNISGKSEKWLLEKINNFLIQETIIALKEQPKKDFALKEMDIKPMITKMHLSENMGERYCLDCLLLCGSRSNLKPELLLKSLSDFCSTEFDGIRINREEAYTELDNQLLDLLKYAEYEARYN